MDIPDVRGLHEVWVWAMVGVKPAKTVKTTNSPLALESVIVNLGSIYEEWIEVTKKIEDENSSQDKARQGLGGLDRDASSKLPDPTMITISGTCFKELSSVFVCGTERMGPGRIL